MDPIQEFAASLMTFKNHMDSAVATAQRRGDPLAWAQLDRVMTGSEFGMDISGPLGRSVANIIGNWLGACVARGTMSEGERDEAMACLYKK
jgi:hypothetical protein